MILEKNTVRDFQLSLAVTAERKHSGNQQRDLSKGNTLGDFRKPFHKKPGRSRFSVMKIRVIVSLS